MSSFIQKSKSLSVPDLSRYVNGARSCSQCTAESKATIGGISKAVFSRGPKYPQKSRHFSKGLSSEAEIPADKISAFITAPSSPLMTPLSSMENLAFENAAAVVLDIQMPRQATATIDVNMPMEGKSLRSRISIPDGGLIVPVKERGTFDEKNLERYLSGGKSKLFLSTSALFGKGLYREFDLKKEVNGKEVPDEERQKKADIHFAKIKFLLGLDKDTDMTYSIKWHFIEIEASSQRYDLTQEEDIEKLFKQAGFVPSKELVKETHKELLALNKNLKILYKRDIGLRKAAFLQDGSYVGNPNGLPLFYPFSIEAKKLQSVPPLVKKMMKQLGRSPVDSKVVKISDKRKEMQKTIITSLNDKLKEEKDAKLKKELIQVMEILKNANALAMDLATLEYVQNRSSSDAAYDYLSILQENNPKGGWMSQKRLRSIIGNPPEEGEDMRIFSEKRLDFLIRKHYQPNKTDKRQAIEFGMLVEHLKNSERSNRLEIIETTQRLQRELFKENVGQEVFREPKGEKFLLSLVFNVNKNEKIKDQHLVGFQGFSEGVKEALKEGVIKYQESLEKADDFSSSLRTTIPKQLG